MFDDDNAGNVFQWAAGEPQGLNQGQCVYVGYGRDEMLDDSLCADQKKGLCQLPANDD